MYMYIKLCSQFVQIECNEDNYVNTCSTIAGLKLIYYYYARREDCRLNFVLARALYVSKYN